MKLFDRIFRQEIAEDILPMPSQDIGESVTFPDYLDGAKVIAYTQRGSFAFTADPWDDENPGTEKEICYVAICQYEGSDRFNVFWCGEDYNVLQDWLWDSVEQCKQMHQEAEGAAWYHK